jgi:prepilin-type N-terminal cleavage/methylation domain-containing protein
MRHERGFTLIELLMAMAIIVVMATLAGPRPWHR